MKRQLRCRRAYIVNFIRFIIFDKTIQASVARDEADMKAGKLGLTRPHRWALWRCWTLSTYDC